MNKYTYRPMENITGFEVAGIAATDPADYDNMPDQLKRHFVITEIPDPVVKVNRPLLETEKRYPELDKAIAEVNELHRRGNSAPVAAPAEVKKPSKPRRRK